MSLRRAAEARDEQARGLDPCGAVLAEPPRRAFARLLRQCVTSKRSKFITFVHAFAKSATSFSLPSDDA